MGKERTGGYYEPALETMDVDNRKAYETELLKQALSKAYQRSPAMKKKFDAAGIAPSDINTMGDLEKVPLTRKAEMREIQQGDLPFGGLAGCNMEELRRIYVSPGPIYDPEGFEECHWRWEKAFYAAGFRKGDIVLNTFAYHMSPAGLMFDEALGNLGCTVIPAGVGNSETQIQVLAELPVTGYVGTPSFLMSLLKKAADSEAGLLENIDLQVALVAGEMLPESMRKAFLDDFKVMVRQCYGTADVGSLGYECVSADGMHVPDEIILEIVDPETGMQLEEGETGEVVVTLNSGVYPLIRFATGDLSYIKRDICTCGRTSKKLGGIAGRVDQLTKVRGMFIHPSQVERLKGFFKEISGMQIIVEREGHEDLVTAAVVITPGVARSDALRESIEKQAREMLKVRASITFIDEIDILEDGKAIVDKRQWK